MDSLRSCRCSLRTVVRNLVCALGLAPIFVPCQEVVPTVVPAEAVNRIAVEFQRLSTGRTDASGLADVSADALAERDAAEDAIARELDNVSRESLLEPMRSRFEALSWQLQTRIALRTCRSALWNVNHISGWQVAMVERLAALKSASPRILAMAMSQMPALRLHVDVEIGNLERGLREGFSAPRSVVMRVIQEIDAVLALEPDQSPLYAGGVVEGDLHFAARWRDAIDASVVPALTRYREYLRRRYAPRARTSLGISGLPNGLACYSAHLRRSTTLDSTPNEVYELGLHTVVRSETELSELGREQFGLSDPAAILQRDRASSANRFRSPEELLAFSRVELDRTVQLSRSLFDTMPAQDIVVEAVPSYQEGAGVPSHYVPEENVSKPGVFRVSLADWRDETRGAAAVTTSHETIPGHHLQIAVARELVGAIAFGDVSANQAYIEGWANYAERLAEEAAIYPTNDAKIFRRAVLGKSLVVDPGVHVFHWSRARARAFMARAGLGREAADDLIDRIAVEPAQLTSYESGGLEIYRLRESARKRLGARFKLPAFHRRVLERGPVLLGDFARYVEEWDGT